jgi:DNA-binding NarL/FixJ family response regulator
MVATVASQAGRRRRLMLVDDHDIVRQGVRALIRELPDWTICAEATGSGEALRLATETRPDIAVVDISMPGLSGLDLIVQLRKLLPRLEVLVLSMHDSERVIAQALRSGARGYVLKSDEGETLIDALKALARHQPYFSGAVSESLLQVFLQSAPGEEQDQLTARERQIVKLVAEGNSNKRIAIALEIGIKTVETHRSSAMRKIGAKSSADIVLYAARNELVQL